MFVHTTTFKYGTKNILRKLKTWFLIMVKNSKNQNLNTYYNKGKNGDEQ